MYKLILTVLFLFSIPALQMLASDFGIGTSGPKEFLLNMNIEQPIVTLTCDKPDEFEGKITSPKFIKSSIILDPAYIEKISGRIIIDINGLITNNDILFEHLLNEKYLNIKKFPKIIIEISGLQNFKIVSINTSNAEAHATGELSCVFTLKNVKNGFNIPVKMIYQESNSKQFPDDVFSIEGKTAICLEDHNIKGDNSELNDIINNILILSFKLYYSSI